MFNALIEIGQKSFGSFASTPEQRTRLEFIGLAVSAIAIAAFALPRPLTCAISVIASMTLFTAVGTEVKEARFTQDIENKNHAAGMATLKIIMMSAVGLLVGLGALISRSRPDLGVYVQVVSVIAVGALTGLSLHTAANNFNR